MIAFDLDGVLCPEFDYIPSISDEQFLEFLLAAKPIFQPTGEYVIVTGRCKDRIDDTQRWISRHLLVQPLNVYYCEFGTLPHIHKKNVISATETIDIFIESELEQVEYLRNNLPYHINVVHIGDLIE